MSSSLLVTLVVCWWTLLSAEAAPQDLGSPIRIAQCRALCLDKVSPPRAPSYRVVTEFLRGPPCRFRIEAEHSWLFTEGISVGDLSEATVSDAREGCFFFNTFPVIFFSPFRLESKRTIIDDDDGPMAALQGLFASIINHTLCGAWPPSSTHANRFLF